MKCEKCGHDKELHDKATGGCAVIYKYYKNPEDRKNNPLNYELKSCECRE